MRTSQVKLSLFAVLAGVVFLAACGGGSTSGNGGGGGGVAAQEAEAAFDDFSTEMSACTTDACDCTGGSGTMTTTHTGDSSGIMVIDECRSAADYTYNGTLSSTDQGATLSGPMDQFGQCSSGTATGVHNDGTCGGTISITCPSGTVNCTVVDGAEDNCVLSC